MNPDVAITIILGGEVALLGIAGGIMMWRAARTFKDFERTERLNRVLASRVQPSADREPQPRPSG
jgi:hypothetical protein